MFTTYNQVPHENSLQIQGESNKFKKHSIVYIP
jgi:hypothetical protein